MNPKGLIYVKFFFQIESHAKMIVSTALVYICHYNPNKHCLNIELLVVIV